MQIVLVHWYIVAGREADFHSTWEGLAPKPGTSGFIDETLCKLMNQDEPGVTKFINVARWRDRQDFERLYGEQPTDKKDFESRLRCRVWVHPLRSNENSDSAT